MSGISGTTRIVALLGMPVDHSRSPAMHNAAFADQGLDLVYVALPTPRGQVATVLAALKAVDAAGGNVTVPHKRNVAALCDVLTPEAEALDAVNTFWWDEDGLLHGDNTDVAGIDGDLMTMDIPPGRAVVVGTGGSSRAACLALVRQGRGVDVVGRRATSVDALVEDIAAAAPDADVTGTVLVDTGDVASVVDAAVLLVNATPLGMEGESLPEAVLRLRPDLAVYDCVYRPDPTPLVAAALAAGAPARDGRGMLLGQAAAAAPRWTGTQPPSDVMAAALEAALTR